MSREQVRETMARTIADHVRDIRLERVFGASEEWGEGVPFEALPADDRRNWEDVAEAVLRISERSHG